MEKEYAIIAFIKTHPDCSSKEIFDGLNGLISYATVKRRIISLLDKQYILQSGNGKNSRYSISPAYNLFYPIDIESYYRKEIDERNILPGYNFSLIPEVLSKVSLFTEEELKQLNELQSLFLQNISQLTPNEYRKEMERLGIDLSWKSSQIEGNTYSLLETERLLKEKETAAGKTKEEAIMLLNHKDALDFIVQNPDYLEHLTVARIEDIHSILIKELGVDRNIRNRRVGITGTNYRPIENEFQIREALTQTCDLVNSRSNIFEKSLLVLVLLSYIQAFNDGNKRVARIVSNAILIANHYCPISFRTVDSVDYKKAMLLFYEQNNISAFKQIFIQQFRFAVETYF
ncbi:Fic family protein [Parabacteroides sp. AF17-28]|uniref:Fic family protein n=1 Tax=Parabacteroides sp. AF17-28 TaxID=2292241 RepID=UPI000EFE0C33|nr:Fic family protein [Parabacteroides sp. AF17-28]RHR49784.1 Fic family protein [Parabacteroides sp. AF17-28]